MARASPVLSFSFPWANRGRARRFLSFLEPRIECKGGWPALRSVSFCAENGKWNQWLKTRLESQFGEFHKQRALNSIKPAFDELTGIEFETYVSRLLKQNGFEDIRGTAATGDQGADLVVNHWVVFSCRRIANLPPL